MYVCLTEVPPTESAARRDLSRYPSLCVRYYGGHISGDGCVCLGQLFEDHHVSGRAADYAKVTGNAQSSLLRLWNISGLRDVGSKQSPDGVDF